MVSASRVNWHNFTDPESRIMKGPDGFVQAYNAQAAFEPALQLTVGQAPEPAGQRQAATDTDDRAGAGTSGTKSATNADRQRLLLKGESSQGGKEESRLVRGDRQTKAQSTGARQSARKHPRSRPRWSGG